MIATPAGLEVGGGRVEVDNIEGKKNKSDGMEASSVNDLFLGFVVGGRPKAVFLTRQRPRGCGEAF